MAEQVIRAATTSVDAIVAAEDGLLMLAGVITQYQKAPTFAVSCESLKNHTYRRGAPL
jgi:hypothetical protein